MEQYKNLEGHSGVTAYKIAAESIVVTFINGDTYLYTYESAGKNAVEKMKRFARTGKGLSTYISQHVRGHFKEKF
ncbi:hypothetical protein ACLI09_10850 [Flavobacterium sp. RHBU_24]|uniref:hypothetical protein n=1 Tax=Flavobacterium sp. RHBU_24 TaxID=3391185 RepID=UPI00398562C6